MAKEGTKEKKSKRTTSAKAKEAVLKDKLPTFTGEREVAMVHFNTPEITTAAILSIRKHGGDKYHVTVFDNSADSQTSHGLNKARPFKLPKDKEEREKLGDVTIIDNTKGQVIDFEKELAKYPNREPKWAMLSNFGSFKHIITVQKLWEILPNGFVLLEGDALVRKPIDWMWREDFAAVGKVEWKPNNPVVVPRFEPYLLYMNVQKLVAKGVSFFDPMRCWALQKGELRRGNFYDTGASLLEDVINGKPELVGWNVKELNEYYDHYHGGSWRKSDVQNQINWLNQRRSLWQI
jgi:hypothetical protein